MTCVAASQASIMIPSSQSMMEYYGYAYHRSNQKGVGKLLGG